MHDINRQLADMRPDSLHGGITIPEADPIIAELANHLNGLLDRAGTAYQEMAEFSARVAHELRTPLMLLRMRVEHAPPGMPPAFQEDLQDELARLSRFVERVAAGRQGGTGRAGTRRRAALPQRSGPGRDRGLSAAGRRARAGNDRRI